MTFVWSLDSRPVAKQSAALCNQNARRVISFARTRTSDEMPRTAHNALSKPGKVCEQSLITHDVR